MSSVSPDSETYQLVQIVWIDIDMLILRCKPQSKKWSGEFSLDKMYDKVTYENKAELF